MSDNRRNRSSITGKGYYIALILCAAAIGISGYLYQKNEKKVQQVSVQETEPMIVVVDPVPEDLPVIAPREPVPLVPRQPHPEPVVPEKPAEKEVLKTMSPLAGQEIAPYSVEALCYNETTRDWRIHDGVDLAAEPGTKVLAAADGRVYETFEDDKMGSTVVLVHDGGYATRYASLQKELLVKPGEAVTMGQPIGKVGTTAIVESVLGPHVHFSVSYRDTPMDPADFLNLS